MENPYNNHQEEQEMPELQKHLWHMRWFLAISLVFWILLSIVATVVIIIVMQADARLAFSFLCGIISYPVYLLYRLVKYLFPLSARDAQLEQLRLYAKMRAAHALKQGRKGEDDNEI